MNLFDKDTAYKYAKTSTSIKGNSMPTKNTAMDTYTFWTKTLKFTAAIGLMVLSMVLESKSIIQGKHMKATSS